MGQGQPTLDEKQMIAPAPPFSADTRIFFDTIRPIRHDEFARSDVRHQFDLSPEQLRLVQDKLLALSITARINGTWP